MQCPKCGYIMGAFEKECPRCARLGPTASPPPQQPPFQTQPVVPQSQYDDDRKLRLMAAQQKLQRTAITSHVLQIVGANITLVVIAGVVGLIAWAWVWMQTAQLQGKIAMQCSRLDSMTATMKQELADTSRDQSASEFVKSAERLAKRYRDLKDELQDLRDQVKEDKTYFLVSTYPKTVMLETLDRFGDALDAGESASGALERLHGAVLASVLAVSYAQIMDSFHQGYVEITQNWGSPGELRSAVSAWQREREQAKWSIRQSEQSVMDAYANAYDQIGRAGLSLADFAGSEKELKRCLKMSALGLARRARQVRDANAKQ